MDSSCGPVGSMRSGRASSLPKTWSHNASQQHWQQLCDEYLNVHQVTSIEDAREKLEAWRVDYNARRPHSSRGHLTPNEFVALRQAEWRPSRQDFLAKDCSQTRRRRHFCSPPWIRGAPHRGSQSTACRSASARQAARPVVHSVSGLSRSRRGESRACAT